MKATLDPQFLQLVNCTPHKLTLCGTDGEETTLEPSGHIARVDVAPGPLESTVAPCAIYGADRPGDVVGLPEPVEGVAYVVSGLVGGALQGKGRFDVLVPGTGPKDGAIREAGRIVAITRLKRVRF